MSELTDKLTHAALAAGAAVMEVYEGGDEGFRVSIKQDSSPITEADRRSHTTISEALDEISPGVPVISEEGRGVDYSERSRWEEFYLVDPLDGTKEFINRNGEFTVNIALIRGQRPVLGVIYVPVKGICYYASEGKGAFKVRDGGKPEAINVKEEASGGGLVAAVSRSHPSERLEGFLNKIGAKETVQRGSSLKFCLVAEGKADIYPRFGPTWEWDTAAGHAIVEAAGGQVLGLDGKPLLYNKPSLKHEGFVAAGEPGLETVKGMLNGLDYMRRI